MGTSRKQQKESVSPSHLINMLKICCILIVLFLNSAAAAAAKSLQSCPTLCDPIDGSPSGSPVPGILGEGLGLLGERLGSS